MNYKYSTDKIVIDFQFAKDKADYHHQQYQKYDKKNDDLLTEHHKQHWIMWLHFSYLTCPKHEYEFDDDAQNYDGRPDYKPCKNCGLELEEESWLLTCLSDEFVKKCDTCTHGSFGGCKSPELFELEKIKGRDLEDEIKLNTSKCPFYKFRPIP